MTGSKVVAIILCLGVSACASQDVFWNGFHAGIERTNRRTVVKGPDGAVQAYIEGQETARAHMIIAGVDSGGDRVERSMAMMSYSSVEECSREAVKDAPKAAAAYLKGFKGVNGLSHVVPVRLECK